MKFPASHAIFALAVMGTTTSYGQDRRHVSEPVYPTICVSLPAPLHSKEEQPVIGETAAEQDAASAKATALIVQALADCAPGQAVRLTLGETPSLNAFLVNPFVIPEGISLIIDGGVTVFATRNPTNFQDPSTPSVVCGTIGDYAINQGCLPLLTLSANSGVYGYGVLDGQSNRVLLGPIGDGTSTWWDRLTQKKEKNKNNFCSNQTSDPSLCVQANPLMVSTGTIKGKSDLGSNLVLYKITIRNPPYHTVKLGGAGVTVWGVKVQAPWNIPNSDGFDVHGTDITIKDTIVANGDQEIAITSGATITSYITVDGFKGYSKGGIALLGDGVGITDVLIRKADITGALPSVIGTTVNGVSERMMEGKYGLQSYGQALPNATNDLNALQINTNLNAQSESKVGSLFNNIAFESICIEDIGRPIHVGPIVPFTNPQHPTGLPSLKNITLRDIHVLRPTPQYPALSKGIPTKGERGAYSVTLQAYPQSDQTEGFYNYLTLDNVVFDDDASGDTSLANLTAIGNVFTTKANIYPPQLNALDAPQDKTSIFHTGWTLEGNTYDHKTSVSTPKLAYQCHPDRQPFVNGELYASTETAQNLRNTEVAAGSSIALHAVVQPVMSQVTRFMPDSYGAAPGLLAVGSPKLRNPIVFYEGSRVIGTRSLGVNGTLATFVVENLQRGTHTFRAEYPADRFYKALVFGDVTVEVK